jgi:hypothetical protein
LDLSLIGQAYLQLLGMSQEQAAHFANNVDWTTTFVIPIPTGSAHYSDVVVDGVPGTLIEQDNQSPDPQYMLLWIKDGIVYALTGPGDANTALLIGNSLK